MGKSWQVHVYSPLPCFDHMTAAVRAHCAQLPFLETLTDTRDATAASVLGLVARRKDVKSRECITLRESDMMQNQT